MKKFFAILSAMICMATVSEASSSYPIPGRYDDQCVGQCEDPCVGQCEPSCGFYVGAFGGANWLNIRKMDGFRLKSKTGYTGALSLGYKLDNGFRFEGEVGYRRNRLHAKDRDDVFYSGYDKRNHGSRYTWSYMANFLYDFEEVSCYIPNVVPYVGFGLGYAHSHTDIKGHGEYSKEYSKERNKKSGNGFAYQGIAGVGYRLTDTTTLGVEYRYFAGKNHTHDNAVGLALRQSF